MQDSARKGTKRVYTWLKHGAQSLAIVSSLDCLHVHPPAILSAIFNQWYEVVCPQQHHLQEDTIQAALAHMPTKELVLQDLTCQDLCHPFSTDRIVPV
eukprot:4436355-Amphidinium_carterae.1